MALGWFVVMLGGYVADAHAADRRTIVPLGGSVDSQSGDTFYGVYVPTRFGGELTIKSTDGKVVDIKGPNGRRSPIR